MNKVYGIILSIVLFTSCKNPNNSDSSSIDYTAPQIATINYTLTNVYPHSVSSFTEGLEYHDGFLYESTGDPDYNGNSKLAKIDPATGIDIQKINLAKKYFGEGITVFKGKIYQLTYKEHTCFVYDAKTFKKLNEFSYDGEGWGMTNDGRLLIMDNGTNNLIYRDPETFKIVKTIPVTGVPMDNHGNEVFINEPEMVDGFIYANLWTTDFDQIVKIDPATGKVTGIINLNGLLERYASPDARANRDVMNGIAYDSTGKTFFITGKNWPKLFALKLD